MVIDLVVILGSLVGKDGNGALSNTERVAKRLAVRAGPYASLVNVVNPGASGGFAAMALIDMLGCLGVTMSVGMEDSTADEDLRATRGGILYGQI
jgi:hypothetical protein